MPDYGFSLHGVNLANTNDLLGVWSIPAPATSFDVNAPIEPTDPTWRVELPASIDEARSIIAQQQASLQRSEAALLEAEQRLSQLNPRIEGVASFAIEREPEAELLAAMNQLTAPISFAAPSAESQQAVESSNQWQNFLDQVRDVLAHYARVETAVAGAAIGSTTVDWTGDFETIWLPNSVPESMTLHYHSVHLALASRLALMHMVGIVGTGAIGLAAKFSMPGGQLLVLPAAWKFVQDVLKEWKNLKAVRSGS